MLLKEITYTNFIIFLVVKDIDYAECKSYTNGTKDEIIEVVPRKSYIARRFYVVSEEQLNKMNYDTTRAKAKRNNTLTAITN